MISTRPSPTMLLALACMVFLIGPSAAHEGPRYQVTLHPVAGWTKTCGKDKATGETTCYTSRLFGQDPRRPPILDLSIRDITGEATHVVRFLMPVGLRTDLGLTFSVDGGGARQPGFFKGCVATRCFAEAKFGNPVLASIKRGGTMQIVTTDDKGRRIDFYLSLDGFAAAFNGPGIDDRSIAPPREGSPKTPVPRAGGTSI